MRPYLWILPYMLTPLVLVLAFLVYALPDYQHAWDAPPETVQVAQLDEGYRPRSHALTVLGVSRADLGARETVTHEGHAEGQTTMLVPFVAPGWDPSKPVRVIVRTRWYTQEDLDQIFRATEFSGAAQTAFFDDGLSSEAQKFLEGELGLTLARDAFVLETDTHRYWSRDTLKRVPLVLFAGGYLVGWLLVVNAWRERRRRAEAG